MIKHTHRMGMACNTGGVIMAYIPGKGLGKSEAGIAHSIKVPLKTDTSGVRNMYVSSLLCQNWFASRLGSIQGRNLPTTGGQYSLTKQQKVSLWNRARYYG